MKNYLYFFVFLLYTSQIFSQWNQESFASSNDYLWCVNFVDENTGWISGGSNSEGYLYKTVNGGSNWTKTIFPETYELQSIYFINENIGWSVGDSGIVIKTSDGGNSWHFQNAETKSYLSAIFFIDENNGWICYGYSVGFPLTTHYGVILHTTNGGDNWIVQKEVEKYQFKSIFFINNNIGWATGSNHQNKTEIYITSNGGITWVPITINTIWRSFYSVQFADNLTGWIVGESGIIIKTTDGGYTWFAQTNGYASYNLYSCSAINQDTVYAAGQGGDILCTTNGGANWIKQESSTTKTLNSIYFTDEIKGWAVGYGVVLSTTNGGVTFIEGKIDATPSEYLLEQNYPNPFNPNTTINYTVKERGFVQLKVYDSIGKLVSTLVSSIKEGGNYSVHFNSENLSSGLYFYTLRTSSKTITKKMLLVR